MEDEGRTIVLFCEVQKRENIEYLWTREVIMAKSQPHHSANLADLPDEILLSIIGSLSPNDIGTISMVLHFMILHRM